MMKRALFTLIICFLAVFQTSCDELANLIPKGCNIEGYPNYNSANLLPCDDENGDGILNGSMDLGPGDYEFVVFCSGESDDFSGWGLQFETTPGSDCDFDSSDEYGNYGFTLEDADLNISYCAGSCASSCSEDNSCLNNGDVNLDGTLNVVDLVAIVAHILQSNILSDDVVCRADGNNDEVVNVVDIVYYVSIILSRN